jgi:hypothetical protein
MVVDGKSILLFPILHLLLVDTPPKVDERMAFLTVKPVVMNSFTATAIAIVAFGAVLGAVEDE